MILIVADHGRCTLSKATLELVSVGRSLAASSGRPLAGLVLGDQIDAVAEDLATYLPEVYAVSDSRLDPPRAETAARAVTHAAKTLGATIVLVPGSRAGASFGPRVAMRLDGAFLEGVTSIGVDEDTLTATRPTYLARFSATVATSASVAVVCLSQGAAPAAAASATVGGVHALDVTFESADERLEVGATQVVGRRRVDLQDADVVVCGGRGLGSSEAFERHVVQLADRLNAGVGVTRAVVDAGWRPFDDLIGQTGKTIAPKLCLTLGVSGAVHLLSGMNRARVIVAINKDAGAPIFRASDYGIVGDVLEVVPALQAALDEHGPGT